MLASVYIDGFNLYYGAVRGTPFKWLNVARMCQLLLPDDQIVNIKYFTAMVNPRPRDPDQRVRQETYLRALRTIPNLEIILGTFLTHEVTMPLADNSGRYARVVKTEEKGSDVNIATHLLMDGFKNRYELAVIVSNDSDLLVPIQTVIHELKKPVGILVPAQQGHPSVMLARHATFVKHIRQGVLANSQFPPVMTDALGTFVKPASW
ncbi:MAG: NYN domain-containing protein [Candidatus Roseilinea sp.]|nr:NYN domain-containing protein [Candidatus Roseilinea sp.]